MQPKLQADNSYIMIKKTLIAIMAFLAFNNAIAANLRNQEYPFQANLYGGLCLTEDPAWAIEPNISWSFNKYLGVSFGIEFTSQFGNSTRSTMIDGHQAWLIESQVNPAWILFKPSLIIKTPNIWQSSDQYIKLWLQAAPGISMGTPFHNSLTYEVMVDNTNGLQTLYYRSFKNEGLQWFNFDARLSVNLAIDRYVIGAGYSISTLDYYSGRRNVTLENGTKFHVPGKKPCQTIFLSIGYLFGSMKQPKPKTTATPLDFIL